MKKCTVLFLFFLCLNFNIIGLKYAHAATITFKEGIYTLADLNASLDNVYNIKNVSNTNGVRVFIYDEDDEEVQIMKLKPDSIETETIPFQANYKLVVVGNGEITVTQKST